MTRHLRTEAEYKAAQRQLMRALQPRRSNEYTRAEAEQRRLARAAEERDLAHKRAVAELRDAESALDG